MSTYEGVGNKGTIVVFVGVATLTALKGALLAPKIKHKGGLSVFVMTIIGSPETSMTPSLVKYEGRIHKSRSVK